ncbi:antitoxin [Cedecea sp. NFIX57]|uniref:antitoxin n=1 Tax=Cedecea sp. NFIX57 TaxID=1566286 RepID=UPI000A0D2709|nr:antitoxin [Cedecea sp. NFIX57]SMG60186.1 hypothetical protein SAMN03159353_103428 [Cedecea sp. NFIX57]
MSNNTEALKERQYIVILQRAWCNAGKTGIEYSSDLIRYDNRKEAISHGFQQIDSDDFNVGVIQGSKLVSFDWMDNPVGKNGVSVDTLVQIAESIGLEASND